ncbi:DDE_3 domain-containing protein [Trichonephila clavipes]|nr:DDE_3 domain-containing protein [Trichonephila clavipes]
MDDNARPHRANIVDECLQSEDITRMDWPAYSPDLNPIEHVWDVLGRRIAARQPPPTCLSELRRALLDEWCNIPQDQIDNLILSMRRRCAVTKPITSHGHLTLAAKVAEIPVYSLIPERKFGTWSSTSQETHQQCVLFAPDPVMAARLETHNVYPDIGARGGLSWNMSKRMGARE